MISVSSREDPQLFIKGNILDILSEMTALTCKSQEIFNVPKEKYWRLFTDLYEQKIDHISGDADISVKANDEEIVCYFLGDKESILSANVYVVSKIESLVVQAGVLTYEKFWTTLAKNIEYTFSNQPQKK